MKKLVLLVGLLLISSLALADGSNGANALGTLSNFFSLSPNDYSYGMLTRLFGQVGGVLPGQIGLLGTMFYTFNQVVLALGIIVVIYTVVMSILHTAHEGEFMGKNYNSMWVPIRTVLGIVLLVPTASGYSLVQIFMMWLVLQGVGAADSVWETALTYIQNNSSVITAIGPQFTAGTVDQDSAVNVATNVLLAEICMQRAAQSDNSSSYASPYPPTLNPGNATSEYDFITYQDGTITTNCGSISWPTPGGPQDTSPPLAQNTQTGIQDMVNALNNTAFQYVSSDENPDAVTGINPIQVTSDTLMSLVQDASQSAAVNATANSNPDSNPATAAFWQQAYNYGWADAGGYYQSIATLGTKAAAAVSLTGVVTQGCSATGGTSNTCQNDQAATDYSTFVGPMVAAIWQQEAGPLSIGNLPSGPNTGAVNAHIASKISGLQKGFAAGLKTQNPMVFLQSYGNTLLQAVGDLWLVAISAIIAGGIVANICRASNPAGPVFNLIVSVFGTPATVISGMLLVAGLTMSVYMPLIPYIIFTFGVIGWLIAVVETMLAAPLVALGITHPEGKHEVLGHAEPAMMLILNVFMRPTLMIFGLLAGMLVSYVGVQFLNWLYGGVVSASLGDSSNTVGAANRLTVLMMYITIYIGIIIVILNKSFALVHIIPDRILNWIGGSHAQFGDYSRGEEDVRGTFNAAAGKAQEGMKATQEGVAGAGATATQYMKDKDKQKGAATTEENANKGGAELYLAKGDASQNNETGGKSETPK